MFELVVKQLRDADFSTLEKKDASNGLFILAVSELALGNDAMSQRAFVRLYTEDPDFEAPQSSKKVMTGIERAKKQVVMSIRTDMQGDAVRVCGSALPRRSQIKVIFTTATGEEAAYATQDGKCFSATPKAPESVTGYYVSVAVDGDIRATAGSRAWPLAYERGRVPAAAKNPALEPGPKTIVVDEGGTPWYKHWATWTIVGVVVAGAVTGAVVYVATRPNAGTIEATLIPPEAR